ncbi:MAG: PQQ-binding-like beta-propeller repeat protein [Verrucomicrobiales bacterium]
MKLLPRHSFAALAIAVTPALSAAAPTDSWLQFRGGSGTGYAEVGDLPQKFDGEKSIAWKIDLPGEGLGSPVVVGDKVIVTCSSGPDQQRLHVFCFSAQDGSEIWERQFFASGRTMCHDKTSVAAPSPCSDGERIFALYSSNDLVCLDLDGNLLWLRGLTYDYPNASNSLGMASSPIVAGGVLIAQIENDSESFAAGIDVQTGKNLWKRSRPKAANWTSPVVGSGPGGSDLALLQSKDGVDAVDPKSGETAWSFVKRASTIRRARRVTARSSSRPTASPRWSQ